jgi:hypothetical protein
MRYTESADRGLAHAELGVHAASRIDDARLNCRAWRRSGPLRFNTGGGIPRAQMEQALALERSLPEWPLADGATWVSAHQLVWSGDLERTRRLLDEWHEAVKTREDPEKASPLWYLSILEWRVGNWELAAPGTPPSPSRSGSRLAATMPRRGGPAGSLPRTAVRSTLRAATRARARRRKGG